MKLNTNIKNCRKGRLNAGILLLHDNTRPRVAGLTQLTLTALKFGDLKHPVCSSDLSSCDYEVFGSLKKCLEGKCFSTDKEIKKGDKEWMDIGSWGGILERYTI